MILPDPPATSHGGLLIPPDPFRISMLAAAIAEVFVSKARNILDAKLVLTRHPTVGLILGRIEGSIVGPDPAEFWRENADIVLIASQVMPRQCFMYYANTDPKNRREGFVVAQRGQVLAADEATPDRVPPGTPDTDWPVSRLTSQMQITMADLADGFSAGPRVEVPLVEPRVDDQALLMQLLEAGPPEQATTTGTEPGAKPAAKAPAGPDRAAEAQADAKRRVAQAAEEAQAQQARAAQVSGDLEYVIDDMGIVVAPQAELSEPEILSPFIVSSVSGDLPGGLPRDLTRELQGKRVDLVVVVEFLSEVFVENTPLRKNVLAERAQSTSLAGRDVQTLEVLAPRLGYGTLVSAGGKHVFISRKPGLALPAQFLATKL